MTIFWPFSVLSTSGVPLYPATAVAFSVKPVPADSLGEPVCAALVMFELTLNCCGRMAKLSVEQPTVAAPHTSAVQETRTRTSR